MFLKRILWKSDRAEDSLLRQFLQTSLRHNELSELHYFSLHSKDVPAKKLTEQKPNKKTNGSLKKFPTFGRIQITCWFISHRTPAEKQQIRCGFIMKTKFAPKHHHLLLPSPNEFPSVCTDRYGKFPSRR